MFEKITGMMTVVLSPLFTLNPLIAVLIFSVFLTGVIILINRFAVNRNLMKEIKTKMTEIRENLTKAQKEGNKEDTNKFLNEYMQTNSQMMKQNFKSLAISMVFVFLFLPVLSSQYKGVVVATLPFSLPIIGSNMGWLLWYFFVSLTISWVIRKIIGE
jgi:uncharacterized membrane protein (DUF106 family)